MKEVLESKTKQINSKQSSQKSLLLKEKFALKRKN